MKLLLAITTVSAAVLVPSMARAAVDNTNEIHPVIGVALTGGGDKLASVAFQNGGSRNITAGGLVQLWGGVEYRDQGSPFAFQATLGYHFDNTSASNGSQRFERFPVELIALYGLDPKFRLGVGARYAAAAKFKSSGAGNVGNYSFKSQLAPVLIAEWLVTPSWGVQARYVRETYKLNGVSFNGSHGGIGIGYYF